jgi:hypothetical protein
MFVLRKQSINAVGRRGKFVEQRLQPPGGHVGFLLPGAAPGNTATRYDQVPGLVLTFASEGVTCLTSTRKTRENERKA